MQFSIYAKKNADNSNLESYSNKLIKRRFNISLNQLNSINKIISVFWM